MGDVHDRETRSYNMSRIRGSDTKPELLVRKHLHSKGLRYRLHVARLPGKPDLVFPRYKTLIFVNGCFWHGHIGCRYYKLPKTRPEWWLEKINKNKERDEKNKIILTSLGWHVITVWECELKKEKRKETLEQLYLSIIRNE